MSDAPVAPAGTVTMSDELERPVLQAMLEELTSSTGWKRRHLGCSVASQLLHTYAVVCGDADCLLMPR